MSAVEQAMNQRRALAQQDGRETRLAKKRWHLRLPVGTQAVLPKGGRAEHLAAINSGPTWSLGLKLVGNSARTLTVGGYSWPHFLQVGFWPKNGASQRPLMAKMVREARETCGW
ncbi:unnamed protein product [Cuscuta europaea]|uniref:Uncharacterized protein n=1 Tax=Cuscuta europaea TaxID=41803 RepID=A0A9P1E3T8_CUSEU|nr:unnamed protein product [Cuscuta europaea]